MNRRYCYLPPYPPERARFAGVRRLSGYSPINTNAQMAPGYTYVFHFKVTNTSWFASGSIRTDAVTQVIAADANFSNPIVLQDAGSTFQVSFIYSGRGSLVYQAALEMQKVVNDATLSLGGLLPQVAFVFAEGGPTSDASGQTVQNAISDPTTQTFDSGSASGDGWGSFLGGMGVGGVAVLAFGAVLLLRKL